MGRDWHWNGGSKSSSNTKRKSFEGERQQDLINRTSQTAVSSGCMSAVFQFFDFHHFQFPLYHHHHQPSSFKTTSGFLPHEPITLPKGMEAPRNSLESEEELSVSPTHKVPNTLNIPMGIQIKTRSKFVDNDCSAETSYSPGTKNPNLVARLMGLDLLPDSPSSSYSYSPSLLQTKSNFSSTPKQSIRRNSVDSSSLTGTCSLPETPRISSARKSDVDRHRLSLQINRDNNNCSSDDQIEFCRFKNKDLLKHKEQEENMSPREYARQIVKQVKERVNRRFGAEITNTVKNREQPRRDQELVVKGHKINKNSDNVSISQPQKQPRQPEQGKNRAVKNFKRAESEIKFGSSVKKVISNKQEEPFVFNVNLDKKSKKTVLSNDLLKSTASSHLSVKKNPPPLVAGKLLRRKVKVNEAEEQKQPVSSQGCKDEASHLHTTAHDNSIDYTTTTSTSATNTTTGGDYDYVTRILKHIGFDKNTPVLSTPILHPLKSSVFYHLENFTVDNSQIAKGELDLRCNRMLLFDLVDEILVDFLKPGRSHCAGVDLVDKMCSRIGSYPRANCRVLEDIDALIDRDLPNREIHFQTEVFEEEKEDVAMEIERSLLEKLVYETMVDFVVS